MKTLKSHVLTRLLAWAVPLVLGAGVGACGNGDDDERDVIPSITAADQTLDDAGEVVVAEAVAPDEAIVVIHEDDDGAPGAIIGWRAVMAGTTADITVTLDRPAADGETLWAMLHDDEGTEGEFEEDRDTPLLDADGNPVQDSFVVTVPGGDESFISADDQTADPVNQVVVAEVFSVGPGWVVIHEDDEGAPGMVLGQMAVPDGASADVTVTLDRDVVDGETLYAMLHIDAGEVGTYEFPGADEPALDADGNVVVDSFVVSLPVVIEPSITVEDQTADPANEVLIAEAVSAGPGWVVIHEDDEGAPGAVIGNAAVVEGTNTDVMVTLDRAAVDGETLHAMLHIDAGEVGTYEFPGPDEPAVDMDGNVVVMPFVVTVPVVTDQSITAEDQEVAPADEVVVAEVVSAGPGWVVIHEDDEGAPGAVIGNVAVAQGTSTDVTVTLDRAALDGETLHAMLHIDAGEAGVYEFPGPDEPALDADGNVVVDAFVVTVPPAIEPSITAEDQMADPASEVVVAEAVSAGPGWVVIHEDDGGSPGAVIGFAAVSMGTNTDVLVTLDRDAADGETLYAMLHIDAGEEGTYEFPGPDGPAMDMDGEVVVDPFVVSVEVEPAGSIAASDQTLDDLSTVVLVDSAMYDGDGWVVIHEDDGGSPGAVVGFAGIAAGTSEDVSVVLDRPAADGETLYAMLHMDAGDVGVYEFPGEDGPVLGPDEAPVTDPFVVTVPAGTPAIRLTVTNIGVTSYDFTGVEPAGFAGDVVGDEGEDQTLFLNVGWRYEIVNEAVAAHPFELIMAGGTPAEDTVHLSQMPGVDGGFEADPDVDWVDDSGTSAFTLTSGLADMTDAYRCAIHIVAMRGDVVTQ